MTITYKKQKESKMGEYECLDCNEMFWAEEPPYPLDLCDECKEERKERANDCLSK